MAVEYPIKVLTLVAGVVVFVYVMYVAAFYGSYRPVEGYSCRPTITFNAECTGPDGVTWKVYDRG